MTNKEIRINLFRSTDTLKKNTSSFVYLCLLLINLIVALAYLFVKGFDTRIKELNDLICICDKSITLNLKVGVALNKGNESLKHLLLSNLLCHSNTSFLR